MHTRTIAALAAILSIAPAASTRAQQTVISPGGRISVSLVGEPDGAYTVVVLGVTMQGRGGVAIELEPMDEE